ncbi:MAG TPA: hypothetical protein VGF50_12555 [Caulobacteraceae bacterium]|jgi:hypothetical protein
MLECAERLSFYSATAVDLAPARVVAAKLMAHQVASEATLSRILAVQPASTLILREDGAVAGMTATLLLRPEAEPALTAGAFDGMDPPDQLLARGSDAVGFYYIWGIAGSTKSASSAVMELSRRFRYGVLAELTAYAVAATPVGRHVGITQLGFEPVRHPGDDLLVSPAQLERVAA